LRSTPDTAPETPRAAPSPSVAAAPSDPLKTAVDAPDAGDTPALRWINAQIEDHVLGEPLLARTPFMLDLSVDADRGISAVACDRFSARFPDDVDEIELLVVLESDDCDISVKDDRICVPRFGPSTRNARFELTPRQEGACTVRALVFAERNFVQCLKITLAIGTGETYSLRPEPSGRNIDAVIGLGTRDITLVIQPAAGGGFDCIVIGATHASGRLPIGQAELAAAIRTARRAIMRVVNTRDGGKYPFQESVDIEPAQRDGALRTLAEAGYLLFRAIFFGPAADAQSHVIGNWLLREANGTRQLKVQIVARDFPVPWAMLYLTEAWDDTTIDSRRFLGMRHVIEQIPSQMNLSTSNEKIGRSDSLLPISLTFNGAIDAQMQANHVSRQNEYWDGAATRAARPLTCTRRTGKADFIAALRSPNFHDEIIYLFCHAESVGLENAGGPAASWLSLADGERVTLSDLRLRAPEALPLCGNPLVFINACESAELSPEFYDGFVPYFMSKGARGVIGTECKTPAQFAVDWSIEFFDRFLNGKPLGEVVLELRQMFYEVYGNPLGLIYAVHCDGDTVVAQAAA
jgi:hypothetical protein